METVGSSGTLVTIYQTRRCFKPKYLKMLIYILVIYLLFNVRITRFKQDWWTWKCKTRVTIQSALSVVLHVTAMNYCSLCKCTRSAVSTTQLGNLLCHSLWRHTWLKTRLVPLVSPYNQRQLLPVFVCLHNCAFIFTLSGYLQIILICV
jgi:hypothetical protein